jgi:hypothetical protein
MKNSYEWPGDVARQRRSGECAASGVVSRVSAPPPETLERFGGARKYAAAVNASLTRLGELLHEPESIRDLLLGKQ